MNYAWIRAQDRKRQAVAALSTVCLYAIAILGAWLIGSLAPASLASVPSTVIVDLGGVEGPPGAIPQGLENAPERPADAPPGAAPAPGAAAAALPEAASAVAPIPEAKPAPKAAVAAKAAPKPAAAKVAVPKAAAPKAAVPPSATAAKAAPPQDSAAAQAAAQEAAAAQAAAAKEAAAAQAAAVQAAIEKADADALAAERSAPPKKKTFGSASASSSGAASGAPVTSGGSGTAPGVSGGTGSVTFKGSEMGNALATTFGASSGLVGRNIYVPIYLYMPLPSRVSDAIFRNILAKETFRSFYQQSGGEWMLKAQVPLAQRGDFWTMLEAAGYDASTADFKTERRLSPVVLEFAVGPLARNKVELIDLRLVTSSGSSEVDEAVIYGFKQASFFNKTGNAVAGKFVYGF